MTADKRPQPDADELRQADVEANLFAMELLMPEELVRRELAKHPFDLLDEKKMRKLADQFEVPLTAMAMRIGQILKP
jgi:Zn-dependent peptidase ImmA (M78 family)